MATIPDKIRATLKRKLVIRITGKSRSACGYDVLTPTGTVHCPNKSQAEVMLLTLARIATKQVWEIKPTRKAVAS